MEAARVLGRHQHEKQMSRLAVERFEIHALDVAAEGAQYLPRPRNLAMRYRDPISDRGRTQAFALAQYGIEVGEWDFAMPGAEQRREFMQYLGLVAAANIRGDQFGSQNLVDFHFSGAAIGY